MSAAPSSDALALAAEVATGDDRWAVIGRELHVRYARGAGTPDVSMDALLKRLGMAATARNLRTVTAVIALAG